MNRAKQSEQTFADAQALAAQHGMTLINPSSGCYQLRNPARDWIINLYPRRNGFSPRMYHDPNHRGPFLDLPENWTLLDAVQAAVNTLPRVNPDTLDGLDELLETRIVTPEEMQGLLGEDAELPYEAVEDGTEGD